ncbi:MAG: metallophosphoesterase [Pseudomonadales bacterium]|nr:metallophosphoesterase [Pseudomonadales bacterium]
MSVAHLQPLLDGPIDVVGDVHAEYEPLQSLLQHLGYDTQGVNTDGRRLVFVGDLCDRGPDSIAVIDFVRELIDRQLAQCVLGNHELNLLRGAHKDGNGWFFATDHDRAKGQYRASRHANDAERRRILAFCAQLPIALERADLRVVHASWHAPSIARIVADSRDTVSIYADYAQRLTDQAIAQGLRAAADAEEIRYKDAIVDRDAKVPLLVDSGREDELYQMGNPLRIVTSGQERLAKEPFYASGKWRMLDRVEWWEDYADPIPVIFGHFWRAWSTDDYGVPGHPKRDVFPGKAANQWLGPAHASFCVDFSIGARFRERETFPQGPFKTRLAAVRWPERELITDRGERCPLVA